MNEVIETLNRQKAKAEKAKENARQHMLELDEEMAKMQAVIDEKVKLIRAIDLTIETLEGMKDNV